MNKYILPLDQLQAMLQDIQLKVAAIDCIALPCLIGLAGFYQEMILHIVPTDHLFAWTSLVHDSIPSKETNGGKTPVT